MENNQLYFGDNLKILREYIKDESVDLIYLDPPFNSKATYNVLFEEKNGTQSHAQIEAFEDTWHWVEETEKTYCEIVTLGTACLVNLIQTLRSFLGQNDMMAYLTMMTPRLMELYRVLKPTGSIYLHCDPTASHYLKILMDAIFGAKNFRNEIIWRRTGAHSKSKRYAPIHDTIFFYTKSNAYNWTYPKRPYMRGHVEEYFIKNGIHYRTNYYGNVLTGSGIRGGESGKQWRGFDPTSKGRHWAIPGAILKEINEDLSNLTQHEKLDRLCELGFIKIVEGQAWPIYERYITEKDGLATPDIWAFQPYTKGTLFNTDDGIDEDVRWLSPRDQERLGYPTQKPEGILKRIIEASSKKGDLILDPFCGCGTTIAVAERFNRKWIGIDITHLAISLMKQRLKDTFGSELSSYEVIGDPKDQASARALAQNDRYQFEWWVLDKIFARPANDKKKGADKGVDGYIYFFDDNSGIAKKIVIQVKSGHVKVGDIRDLKGVVEREQAVIGAFITLEKPTKPMREESIAAGFYKPKYFSSQYPRIQIITVEELFDGKKVEYLKTEIVTFKKPKMRSKKKEHTQRDLLG